MFKRVNVPVLGVVENMSYFLCPSCGTRSGYFRSWRRAAGGRTPERAVPRRVPLHMTIREKSDAGLPVVATEPDGVHARHYVEIAREIWTAVSTGAASKPAPRIVIESRRLSSPYPGGGKKNYDFALASTAGNPCGLPSACRRFAR